MCVFMCVYVYVVHAYACEHAQNAFQRLRVRVRVRAHACARAAGAGVY
jgi:hypothetical protein